MDSNIATTRAPRRARAVLNRLVQSKQLSPTGLNWLVAATDPFHDTEVHPAGFPDMATSRSVVQCVNLTTTVKTPLDNDDNWDLHVFFLPLTHSFQLTDDGSGLLPGYYQTKMDKSGLLTQTPITFPSGLNAGLNIIGTEEGAGWQDDDGGAWANNSSCAISSQFSNDTYRLVAAGFELVNVTAELYKGGSLTVYRNPSRKVQMYTQAPVSEIEMTGTMIQAPPNKQADAAVFPDSKTWGATDGAYCVCTLNDVENSYFSPVPGFGGLYVPPQNPYTDYPIDVWLPWFSPAKAISESNTTALNWDQSGLVATGLNSNSAIQINCRYYFERVPTPSDQALQVLTHPAPPFDPLALEIYSRCMSELPVGVPVGENPLGEWFNEVLSMVADYAPTVGNALSAAGVPFAGSVGGILSGAAKAIQNVTGKSYTVDATPTTGRPARVTVQPKQPSVFDLATYRTTTLRPKKSIATTVPRNMSTLSKNQRRRLRKKARRTLLTV